MTKTVIDAFCGYVEVTKFKKSKYEDEHLEITLWEDDEIDGRWAKRFEGSVRVSYTEARGLARELFRLTKKEPKK